MKILITFYYLNSLGGIINNQEGLYAGLRKLGHKVDVILLEWKESTRAVGSRRDTRIKGRQGMYYDQDLGWVWPVEKRIPYKGSENMKRWKDFASKYDLIIWQIPVPTMQRGNFGNSDWPEIYNIPVKQIVFVHDGNFRKAYPWLVEVRKHLCGVAAVHPCAYHAVKSLGLPRALTFSPQINIKKRLDNTSYKDREVGFLSLQTFKLWKRVPELVRAIPHMERVDRKILAGGGWDYFYMTSKEKLKDNYLVNRKRDPDINKEYLNQRIWDVALSFGMEYIGYVHNKKRDKLLSNMRLLIDPSWSKSYSSIGDHPNRVVVDGLIRGCIPVARNLGLSTNEEGIGEFYKAGENYVMIPWNATPREFGEIVSDAANMRLSQYRRMLEAGRELLPLYDYKATAQAFIDLSKGKPAGVYQTIGEGEYDPGLEEESSYYMNTFFAGKKGHKRTDTSNRKPKNALI